MNSILGKITMCYMYRNNNLPPFLLGGLLQRVVKWCLPFCSSSFTCGRKHYHQ